MIDRTRLSAELIRFARLLVNDYAVSDALHDVVDAVTAVLGIRGAGVSLARDDELVAAAANSEEIADLERVQEQAGAGPCIEAYRTGKAVFVGDLTVDRPRWPALAATAANAGIVATAGVPMHLNGTRLGALNLYDSRPHDWTEDEAEVAALLAAIATGYVVNASRLDQVRHTAEQLQEALDSRIIIEQAKGVIAGQRNVSVDEAFLALRAHARSNNVPLRDVADGVVNLGLRP